MPLVEIPALKIPCPETTRLLLKVPDTLLLFKVFPEALSVMVDRAAEFEIVIVDKLNDNPIPAPATKLMLDDDPFKLKLFGPMTEIVDRLFEIVILLPPTMLTLSLVPFRTNEPPIGDGAMIERLLPLCERVTLLPPNRVAVPELINDITPAVFPLALSANPADAPPPFEIIGLTP